MLGVCEPPGAAFVSGAKLDEASAARASSTDVAGAFDEVLEGAQLTQADRPACVELLGGVPDLRTHPELAPVGEARRGVDVDAGGVDPQLESARRRRVERHDRLRVPAAVARDVLDCLVDARDDPDRERRAEVLGRPVVLGRR